MWTIKMTYLGMLALKRTVEIQPIPWGPPIQTVQLGQFPSQQ